jgi:hypothetical protein
MGSIQIEMRRKRNPNPNPKDVGVYLDTMAESAIVEDDVLREGPQGTARPPPLVGSSACQLWSPP